MAGFAEPDTNIIASIHKADAEAVSIKELDSLTVSLYSPNGRQFACR